jgi:hypothetical protein
VVAGSSELCAQELFLLFWLRSRMKLGAEQKERRIICSVVIYYLSAHTQALSARSQRKKARKAATRVRQAINHIVLSYKYTLD